MLLHDCVIEVGKGEQTDVLKDSAGLLDWVLQTGAETAHGEVISRVRSRQQETAPAPAKKTPRKRSEK